MINQEKLEIVDENNQLTGRVEPRALAHATGLWHQTIHIYFFRKLNDKLEFLVHLRSKAKDLKPNTWDTRFGGHIQGGQSIEKAVISEIKEEVGLEISFADLIEGDWQKSNHYPNNEFAKVFYFNFKGDQNNLKFADSEVQKVKWLACDDILKSMAKEPAIWAASFGRFKKIVIFLENRLK